MKPLNNRIIMQLALEEPEKKGLFILPPDESEKDTFMVIYAAANEQGIKAGDKVLVDQYDVRRRKVGGEEYYFTSAEAVLAIL